MDPNTALPCKLAVSVTCDDAFGAYFVSLVKCFIFKRMVCDTNKLSPKKAHLAWKQLPTMVVPWHTKLLKKFNLLRWLPDAIHREHNSLGNIMCKLWCSDTLFLKRFCTILVLKRLKIELPLTEILVRQSSWIPISNWGWFHSKIKN